MDLAPILTFAGALATGILTVLGTVYVARAKAKTDIGQSITNGFQALTDQLQQEREELNEIIDKQKLALDDSEKRLVRLQKRMRKVERHMDTLERMLMRNGIDIPAHDFDDE